MKKEILNMLRKGLSRHGVLVSMRDFAGRSIRRLRGFSQIILFFFFPLRLCASARGKKYSDTDNPQGAAGLPGNALQPGKNPFNLRNLWINKFLKPLVPSPKFLVPKLILYPFAFILLTLTASAQDSFVIDNSMIFEEGVDNSAGNTVNTNKLYTIEVNHTLPLESNEFLMSEDETATFTYGNASISGDSARNESLNTYSHLIHTGFVPAVLNPSGVHEDNKITVLSNYKDSQNFIIDDTFTFDPPVEGEDPPEQTAHSIVVNETLDTHKIYDVDVTHNLPQVHDNFFTYESETVNFIYGRAEVSGANPRTVILNTFQDLTFQNFSPANLTAEGNPENNVLAVTANYKDSQLFNMDTDFVFNGAVQGEEPPEFSDDPVFSNLNTFAFSSFRIYKVNVSHNGPNTFDGFFSTETETVSFIKGYALISGENARQEKLKTYPDLVFNGFTPPTLNIAGSPIANTFNVFGNYEDTQKFTIDSNFVFDAPAEGESYPSPGPKEVAVDTSFDNHKVYDIEVYHSLPLTAENYLSFENDSISFEAGRANIASTPAKTVGLLSYPDLILTSFSPADLNPSGSPDFNKFFVQANYKDSQVYNVDGDFKFDPPVEGQVNPGGAFEVANSFAFNSFRIYDVEVAHNLPQSADNFFALESETVTFENGRANISGESPRVEDLSIYQELTLLGFTPPNLTLSGSPDLNKFFVVATYKDSQVFNFDNNFTFTPPAEGEEPPVGTPISNAVQTFAFDSHKIYNIAVTHNLPETVNNFLMLETETVTFENGRANIAGAIARTEDLSTFPDLTFVNFDPANLTAQGEHTANIIDVLALYKDSQMFSIDNSFVFSPPAEGEEPPQSEAFAQAITDAAFSNFRIYKAEVTHNLPGLKDSFMMLELENASFVNGQATVGGTFPRSISLQTFPQFTLKGFKPQELTAIGAPNLNILGITAEYSTDDVFNFDSTFVFEPDAEGRTINTEDPLIPSGSFDSHRIYKVDVLHNLTAVKDNFLMNENESVSFVKGYANISGENNRAVALSRFPSLTLDTYTPATLEAEGTPDFNNFLVVASYKDAQSFTLDTEFIFDPPVEGEDPPAGEDPNEPGAAVLAGAFNNFKYYELNYLFTAAEKTDTFMVEENTGVSAANNILTLSGGYPDGTFDLAYSALSFSPNNFTIQDQADTKHVVDVETTVESFTINFYAGANGSLFGNAVQQIQMGGKASPVVAVPNSSYAFIGWVEDGDINPIKIPSNVTADATYTAQFEFRTHSVTFTAGDNGSILGDSDQTVGHNLDATPVLALPDPGYKLTSWSDGMEDPNREIKNVTDDISLTASFELNVPVLLSHQNDDLLSRAENLFVWTPVDLDSTYTLSFGTSAGANDLDQFVTTETEFSVSGLPSDGSLVYVRISSDTQGVTAFSDYVLKTGIFPYNGNISLIYRGIADIASRMPGTLEGNMTSILNDMISREETASDVDAILTYYRDQYVKTQPSFINGDTEISQRPEENFSLSGEYDRVLSSTGTLVIDAIQYRQDDRYGVINHPSIQEDPHNPQIHLGGIYGSYEVPIMMWQDFWDIRGTNLNLGSPTNNDYKVDLTKTHTWHENGSQFSKHSNGIDLVFTTPNQFDETYFTTYTFTLISTANVYASMSSGLTVKTFTQPMSTYEVEITEQPVHGTVSVSSSHYITYTPTDPDYIGPDTFTYEFRNKSDGTVYKTVNYKVKLNKADEEYLYDFNKPEIPSDGKPWGQAAASSFENEARNDASRLKLNGSATYEYNGTGGTFIRVAEGGSASQLFTAPNMSFQNGSNKQFAFETRIRFPNNDGCGIVLMESEHSSNNFLKLTLRQDGKLELFARDLLYADGFLTLVSSNSVPTTGWSTISVVGNIGNGSATFRINDSASTKSANGLGNIPQSATAPKLFTRFNDYGPTLAELDIDYVRIITNLNSGTYAPRKGESYFETENYDIFTNGYNWLNRLAIPPEEYYQLQASGQLGSARSNAQEFYHFHPSIYSSYHGMNEFQFGVSEEAELPESTLVTVYFRNAGAQDWRKLIVTNLENTETLNGIQWLNIPWDTNVVQNDWTQDDINSKDEFKEYEYKFVVDSPSLANNTLEVKDYLNGSFKHVFSYDPVVTALQPDKEFSPVQIRMDRNNSARVLRDHAIFNENDKIIDILVRKKIQAPAATASGINTDELFGAAVGDKLSDGTEILFKGNIFFGDFPVELTAENDRGRYVYQTYTIFTDDPDAATSEDPLINKQVIKGNTFVYDSENNREGLEFARSSLKDNFAPFQPVISANAGDAAVGLSWSYQDRVSGRSADIEVERVDINVFLGTELVRTVKLGNVRNAIISDLENGLTYTFEIKSFDSYDNAVSGQIDTTPVRSAVAVVDVSNFKTFVGVDTVALQWHYKPENQAPVNPIAFLKWKNSTSSLTEGTIGFLIFRQKNGEEKLIAALPVDFKKPNKEYLFIDKNLDSNQEYTYKIISIDRKNNRTLGQEETIRTLSQAAVEDLTNIESSQYYSKNTFENGIPANWFGSAKGAVPDNHLTAALPQGVTVENIDSIDHLVIPAGVGKSQLYQRFIPENPAFSASISAQITGANINNNGVVLLSFKSIDNEGDSRFEESSNVVRQLKVYEDHIEFNGNWYGFAHGGLPHTYSVNRFADQFQLIIDGHIVEETHTLEGIAQEQGNSFIRFGAETVESSLTVKVSDLTYVVGVPFYFGGQKQDFDVVPPQKALNVNADNSSAHEVTLSWDAPQEDDVRGYFVSLDNYNGFTAWTRTNSITLQLPDSLLFTGRVTAVDSSGNFSTFSDDIEFTVAPASLGTPDVQDADSDWNGWIGNRQTFAPWIKFSDEEYMEKIVDSGSFWSVELNFALIPGVHTFEDETTVPVMEANTVLKFIDNGKDWLLQFTENEIKYLCQQGEQLTESNSFDFTSGGSEHSLRIINKNSTQYIFLNGRFIGTVSGFEFSSLALGNFDGPGLNVKSVKVLTGSTAATEFEDLNTFAKDDSEPEAVINDSQSQRSNGNLELVLTRTVNSRTIDVKVLAPEFKSFTSIDRKELFDIKSIPLKWIEDGVEHTLSTIVFPADAEPLSYMVSVKPVREDAHKGLGDSFAYTFEHSLGNQISGMRINSEDLTSTKWNYRFGDNVSKTISYPSFVIPFKTVEMGKLEGGAAIGPQFYTAPLQTANFDFSSWFLLQGYEGTLLRLTGSDSQGNPQTIPIVYEDGRLWIYNEAISTPLFAAQINHIRVTTNGTAIQVYLNHNPEIDLEINTSIDFSTANSSLSFGLVNHIDEEIYNQKVIWAEPKFDRNGTSSPFIENDQISTVWTYTGEVSHIVEEHEFFGLTSVRALGPDKGFLQVNKADISLGNEWTVEFEGTAAQGSSQANFYIDDDKKVSFTLNSQTSIYRVIYSHGFYHVTANGKTHASGRCEEAEAGTVAFEIEVESDNPADADSRGAFALRDFKVINNATDSITASLEPLRGALYLEETVYNDDGSINLDKGRMLFQPIYLSTAVNGLNWNFEHNSTIEPFAPVAGQTRHTPVTYDYNPGSYGVTIIESGDFTVGLSKVATTYLPELGPDLNKPRNLNITRTETSITFSWNAPAGVQPNQYLVQLFDPIYGILDFDPSSLDAALSSDSAYQINLNPETAPGTISVTYDIPATSLNKKLQLQIASQFRKGDILTSRSEFLTTEVEPFDSTSVSFDPLAKHFEAFSEDRAIRLQVSFPPADLQGYLLWRSDPDSANNPQAAYVDRMLIKLDENAVDLINSLTAGYPEIALPEENILTSLPVNSHYFFFHGDESSFDFKVNRVHNAVDDNPTYNFAIDPYDDPQPSSLTKPNLGSYESDSGDIVGAPTLNNVNVVNTTGMALNVSPEIVSRRAVISLADGTELPRLYELAQDETIPPYIVNNLDPETILIPSSDFLSQLRISGPVVADRSLVNVELKIGTEVISRASREHTPLSEDLEDVGAGFYYNPKDGLIYHDVNTVFTAGRFLRQGLNIIYLSGEDSEGAKSTAEIGINNIDNDLQTARVMLDNTAPTFSFTEGRTDELGRTILTENFKISGLYNDISGLSNIEILIDGQTVELNSSNAKAANGVFTISLQNTVADGEHTVTVVLTDLAGNVSEEQSINVIFTSTPMSSSITHLVNPFGIRQFYSTFENVNLVDIAGVTMNGQELTEDQILQFYNATDLAPVSFQSMGYDGETEPGNHLVVFRTTVEFEVSGETIYRELTAAAEWYINDDLPVVRSTVPSVNEVLYSTFDVVALDQLIINVFDQDPGVEFDKIEILANAETGARQDVKHLFNVTNFAASLKKDIVLELIPEEGDEDESQKVHIYLTLKEKETGVVVQTTLTYFVLPDTYSGPVITSSSKYVFATNQAQEIELRGKNLSEVNLLEFLNIDTGGRQFYIVDEVVQNSDSQSIFIFFSPGEDGSWVPVIDGQKFESALIVSLPLESTEQADAVSDITGDANNDGVENAFDLAGADGALGDPLAVVANAMARITSDSRRTYLRLFGLDTKYSPTPHGNEDIEISIPELGLDNEARIGNGYVNIEGTVPDDTYMVEIHGGTDSVEYATLERVRDGNGFTTKFYGKNTFLKSLKPDATSNITIFAYRNNSQSLTEYKFKVRRNAAPEIRGFLEGNPEISIYKSLYKSLPVGNELIKRGRLKGQGDENSETEDSYSDLDGQITAANPIDLNSLVFYIDNKKIRNRDDLWEIKSTDDDKQLEIIFKDEKKIDLYGIVSSNIRNSFIDPWLVFESAHKMTVSVTDIYKNTTVVNRPFTVNRGKAVSYSISANVTASGFTEDGEDVFDQVLHTAYEEYANSMHTYIRKTGVKNIGTNSLGLNKLRLEPEDYGISRIDLSNLGVYYENGVVQGSVSSKLAKYSSLKYLKQNSSSDSSEGEEGGGSVDDYYKLAFGQSPFPGEKDPPDFSEALVAGGASEGASGKLRLHILGEETLSGGAIEQLSISTSRTDIEEWKLSAQVNLSGLETFVKKVKQKVDDITKIYTLTIAPEIDGGEVSKELNDIYDAEKDTFHLEGDMGSSTGTYTGNYTKVLEETIVADSSGDGSNGTGPGGGTGGGSGTGGGAYGRGSGPGGSSTGTGEDQEFVQQEPTLTPKKMTRGINDPAQAFVLTLTEGNKKPEIEEGGHTSAGSLLTINDGDGTPSETEAGTANVKVNFPAILGSIADGYTDIDEKGFRFYDMRFNRRYKLYANGFVFSKTNGRDSLSLENLEPQFLSVSEPYAYIQINEPTVEVTYDDDGKHYIDFSILIYDPITAYNLSNDPSGLKKVSVNGREITSTSSNGDSILMKVDDQGKPTFEVKVVELEVRRGLNALFIESENSAGVKTNAFLTLRLNDLDGFKETKEDVQIGAISQIPRSVNPTYHLLHTGHIFGEFNSGESASVSMGSASIELNKSHNRFGRFHREIFLVDSASVANIPAFSEAQGPFTAAEPGTVVSLESNGQSLDLNATGIKLLNPGGDGEETGTSSITLFPSAVVHQFEAFVEKPKDENEEDEDEEGNPPVEPEEEETHPEFNLQIISTFGNPIRLSEVARESIAENTSAGEWPEVENGQKITMDIKIALKKGKLRYDEEEEILFLKPGEYVKVSLGPHRKTFMVSGSALMEEYEKVTGITPTVALSAPIAGMNTTAEVLMNNGQLKLTHSMITVPGRGLPLYLGTTYRSNQEGNSEYLGTGWTASWENYITRDPDGTYTLFSGDGRRDSLSTSLTVPEGFTHEAEFSDDKSQIIFTYISGTVKTFTRIGLNDIWKITSVKDRYSNEVRYLYDSFGKLYEIEDDLGRFYQFFYTDTDHGPRFSRVKLFAEYTYFFQYDDAGDLKSINMNVPSSAKFEYKEEENSELRLLEKVNNYMKIEYDSLDSGKVTEIIRGDEQDSSQQLVDTFTHTGGIKHTDPNDIETTYTASSSQFSIKTGSAPQTNLTFDSNNLQITSVHRSAQLVSNQYESNGNLSDRKGSDRLKSASYLNGTTATYTYHPETSPGFGRVNTYKTPTGVTYTYSYTDKDKDKEVFEEEISTTYTAVSGQNMKTVTKHNTFGQIIESSEYVNSSRMSTTKFDYYVSDDRVKSQDDREGYLYSIITDNVESKDEDGAVINDNQVNLPTYFGRDALGRMTSEVNPKGAATIYGYDEFGQLTTVTSPPIIINTVNKDLTVNNANNTRVIKEYTYSSRGLITKETTANPVPVPNGNSFTYEYLVTETNHSYDQALRLQSSITPYRINVHNETADNVISYTYQNDGKGDMVKSVRNPNGSYDVNLIDDAGRTEFTIQGSSTPDPSNITDGAVLSYNEYNSAGLLERVSLKYNGEGISPGGEERVRYFYDGQFRIDRIKTQNPYRETSFTYTGDSQVLSRTVTDSSGKKLEEKTFAYDGSSKTLTLVNEKVNDTFTSYGYDYQKRMKTVIDSSNISASDRSTRTTETYFGSGGQVLAQDVRNTSAASVDTQISRTVNIYDKQNSFIASEQVFGIGLGDNAKPRLSIHTMQRNLTSKKDFGYNLYSRTDHLIGKVLPSSIYGANKEVTVAPTPFGPGAVEDHTGFVIFTEYNEIGQPLRVVENYGGPGQERETQYFYIDSGYGHHSGKVKGAANAVLTFREDTNTNKKLGREIVYNLQGQIAAQIDYSGLASPANRAAAVTEIQAYEYDKKLKLKKLSRKDNAEIEYIYYPHSSTSENSEKLHQVIVDGNLKREFNNYNQFGQPEEIIEYNYHSTDHDLIPDEIVKVTTTKVFAKANTSATDKSIYGKVLSTSTRIAWGLGTSPSSVSFQDVTERELVREYFPYGPLKKLYLPLALDALNPESGTKDSVEYKYKGARVSNIILNYRNFVELEGTSVEQDIFKNIYELKFNDDATSGSDLRFPTSYKLRGSEYKIRYHNKKNGLIERISKQNDSENPEVFKYTYDEYLRKKTKVNWNAVTQTYQYDALHRLVGATTTNSTLIKTDSYPLDKFESFFDKSSLKVSGENSNLQTHKGDFNEYSSYLPYQELLNQKGAAPGTQTLQQHSTIELKYDENGTGNLIDDGLFTYTWDEFGRIITVENKNHSVTPGIPKYAYHSYDSMGRRVYTRYADATQRSNNQNTMGGEWADRHYLYDGIKLLEEYKIGEVGVFRRYIYGQEHSPVAVINASNNAVKYFVKDELGNPVGLQDENGTIEEKYFYNTTGLMNVVDKQGSSTSRSLYHDFGWAGMYKDSFTGHYQTLFRDFDPVLNRWLSEDPAGAVDGMNLHANYFGVNAIDPDGRFVIMGSVLLGAVIKGAIIGGAVSAAVKGIMHYRDGDNLNWETVGSIGKAAAYGALGGAVGGGIANAFKLTGYAAVAVDGSLGAGLEGFMTGLDNSVGDAFKQGAIGAAMGLVFSAAGKFVGDKIARAISKRGPPAILDTVDGKVFNPGNVLPGRGASNAFNNTRANAAMNLNPSMLPRNGRWTVDPSLQAADELAKVLKNGKYVKNPTAINIEDMVTSIGKLGTKRTNAVYMYVVDDAGNLTLGLRGKDALGATLKMPHPTLVGGANPKVRAAGMVDIRAGRIYSIDNASGHFKPGISSLEAAKEAFLQLPSNAFSKNFQGFLAPFN